MARWAGTLPGAFGIMQLAGLSADSGLPEVGESPLLDI